MRTLSIVEGSRVPVANRAFEEAIGDQKAVYGRVSPATEARSDELRIDAYSLHEFGTVLVDLVGVEWTEEQGPNGTVFSTQVGKNLFVYFTANKKPAANRSTPVKAELRVRTSYPTNRPGSAKEPRVSYTLVLELTPAENGDDVTSRVVIEDSKTWDNPLLDGDRQIFAAFGFCVKRVAASQQPRGNGGGQRDARGGGHQGGRGGGRHGGGHQASRW